ncbi:MAG: TRAM domain-containing protein [Actinocatenispora sp.]
MTDAVEAVRVGERLTLDVTAVAPGGHCVARHAGQVVFVRHALPGEQVVARVTEARGGYLRADAVEILTAAPGRVEPPCPYAGPDRCGGCDWQHADAGTQRALKAAVVTELLTRIGRLGADEVAALAVTVEELPGGLLDWRTRVRYAVDRDGRAGFRAHRSHRVVPVDGCPIATPEVRALPVTGRRWPRDVEVTAVASGAGDSAVLTHQGTGRRPGPTCVVDGPDTVLEPAVGRRFEVPADAFWQVHPAAPDALSRAALDLLAAREGDHVWDLYGGVGLFSAALADVVGDAGSVTMVESGRQAVRAARRNLAGQARFHAVAARVERALPTLRAGVDLVLLDPPRSGAGREVVTALTKAGPRAVCYVACDPAAFARDVRTFTELGWRLVTLRAFDAFPMTQHVECVGLFEPGVG